MHEGELARLFGQLGRVCIAADLGGAVCTAARGNKTARQHLLATRLVNRIGLTGEQRFVDLECSRPDHLTFADYLVTGSEFDNIVEHNIFGRHRHGDAVTPDHGLGLTHDGQSVERALGADLLDDADTAVRDDQQSEHAVDDRTRREHDHQQHGQDRVDASEDVAANDVLDRAGRPVRYIVGLSRRDPCCNLIGGQTAGDVDVVRQSLRRYRHCCLF